LYTTPASNIYVLPLAPFRYELLIIGPGVGFQTRKAACGKGRSGGNSDTMEIEEFEACKKSALGLVSSALRLVGSEDALLAVLEVID